MIEKMTQKNEFKELRLRRWVSMLDSVSAVGRALPNTEIRKCFRRRRQAPKLVFNEENIFY